MSCYFHIVLPVSHYFRLVNHPDLTNFSPSPLLLPHDTVSLGSGGSLKPHFPTEERNDIDKTRKVSLNTD